MDLPNVLLLVLRDFRQEKGLEESRRKFGKRREGRRSERTLFLPYFPFVARNERTEIEMTIKGEAKRRERKQVEELKSVSWMRIQSLMSFELSHSKIRDIVHDVKSVLEPEFEQHTPNLRWSPSYAIS